jgi:hypothetical protein
MKGHICCERFLFNSLILPKGNVPRGTIYLGCDFFSSHTKNTQIYKYLFSIAKVVAKIPLDATFSLVFPVVLKMFTSLRTPMTTLIKTYCLLTVSCASLGFAIGSFSSSVDLVMSTGIFVNVIFMVVGMINPSGTNPDNPPNMIMQVLAFFSPIK